MDSNIKVINFKKEISLNQLLKFLISKYIFFSITFFVFFVFSLIYSLSIPNSYTSESIYSTEEKDLAPGSSIGGLAGIVGIDIGNKSNKANLAIELINSRAFFKLIIEDEEVLKKIYGAKSFNESSKQILFDDDLLDSKNDWKKDKKPSVLEAYKSYSGSLKISTSVETGFIEMSYEHVSPVFASELLNLIVKKANDFLRNKDIDASKEALTFLRDQVRQESVVSVRSSIGKLIEGQLEKLMIAQISEEYFLKSIEPPFVPEEKSSPQRLVIVTLFSLFSIFFSSIFLISREFFKFIKTESTLE